MQFPCWGTMRERVHLCYGMWTGGLVLFFLFFFFTKIFKEYILEVSVGRYVGTHAAVASRVEKKDPMGEKLLVHISLFTFFVLGFLFY